MGRNALLLGGTGFVGPHMERLMQSQYHVVATGKNVDIRNLDQVKQLVMDVKPDVVINFAAITTVKETFNRPFDTYQIGFYGALNLLMVLKDYGFRGKMIQIGSSEVYGFPTDDQLPITEDAPLRPMSPYAVAKIAAEALCYQWSQTESFEIVMVRPFTHIGPGQSDRFAISNFAKQIAEIMLGKRDPIIYVGNLDTTRDFTDVRDIVRAYEAILQKCRSGNVYNICSGKEIITRVLLDELIKCSGLSIKVVQEPSLVRKTEHLRIWGCYDKLRAETGWEPEIPISKTLSDTLAYWVEVTKTELAGNT